MQEALSNVHKHARAGQVTVTLSYMNDVVVLDVEMPRMDGFEAIKIIRSEEETAHIPIIAISAWASAKLIPSPVHASK